MEGDSTVGINGIVYGMKGWAGKRDAMGKGGKPMYSVLIILFLLFAQVAAEGAPLFSDHLAPALHRDDRGGGSQAVIRSRTAQINWEAIKLVAESAKVNDGAGARLDLNLFNDVLFTVNLIQQEVLSQSSHSWVGHIQGQPTSQVTIVADDGVMVGNIRTLNGYYQIRYMGGDEHEIRQIDESRFPPEGEPIPVSFAKTGADNPPLAADSGSIFDVMVVYTSAARSAAGGTTAMNALINLAITETNTAYSRSGVIPRLRLVHRAEIAYSETNNFFLDLDRLTSPSDGFMDNVHSLRNTFGADLVSLWTNGSSLCGLAWLMDTESPNFEAFAFSVVAWDCATGIFALGHELGHNMGLQHDRADEPDDGVFSFSHGYFSVAGNFRTIMATQASCPACSRIQNFSSPNVSHNGVPTGISQFSPASADAVLSINSVRSTVANWRTQMLESAPVDFDGDGKSDVGIYRNGAWSIIRSSDGGLTNFGWGGASWQPVAADYDGDAIVDIAVYNASGLWSIVRSSDGGNTLIGWSGAAGDIPVPADYDGDGKADLAVYNNATAGWSIIRSSNGGLTYKAWGGPAWIPVMADYDGDGKVDIAVYNAGGLWSIVRSSDGGNTLIGWSGAAGDIPVPADYDGDGKADLALYNTASAGWSIIRSSNGGLTYKPWGGPGWEPVPADYDGDGKADIAVYNSSNGLWSIVRSLDGGNTLVGLGGGAQDIPLN
jgi:peptidyl-Asp metalloendopeptidase